MYIWWQVDGNKSFTGLRDKKDFYFSNCSVTVLNRLFFHITFSTTESVAKLRPSRIMSMCNINYDSYIWFMMICFMSRMNKCSILIIFPSVPRLNVESIRNHPIDGNYSFTIWLDSTPLSCASRLDSRHS